MLHYQTSFPVTIGDGEKEFHDDLKRFKYIKRLLKKYNTSGILKERLLLNHIILLIVTGKHHEIFLRYSLIHTYLTEAVNLHELSSCLS